MVFGDPARSTFATALPLVSTLSDSAVFSQVASNDIYFTGLAILNPAGAAASVTIDVYDSAGALIASRQESIPAKQRKSQLLTQYFPELAGQNRGSGYIKFTADRPVASFALFGTHNLSVLSAIPPQAVP